jgi:hypothetical protein
MISWLSIPLNCVLIPPSSVAIVFGFIGLGLGLFGIPWLPDLFNTLAMSLLDPIEAIVMATVRLPYAYQMVSWRIPWIGLVGTVGVFVWLILLKDSSPRRRVWIPLMWVVTLMISCVVPH